MYRDWGEMSIEQGAGGKRPYVRKEQARLLLIDAAIELLRSHPFPQVTTKDIAAAAGLSPMAIQTGFDGQMGLYRAVAGTLMDRVLENLRATEVTSTSLLALLHPDMVLRSKLVAWLLGEGEDPTAFASENEVLTAVMDRSRRDGASEDVVRAFALVLSHLLVGYSIFGSTRPVDSADLNLAVRLLERFRDELPTFSAEFTDGPLTQS
jgi:AcrR family transcriptional regulator